MRKVLVLHTGGTISMVQEESGVTLSQQHPLAETMTIIPEFIDITSEEIFNLPSPHITPENMLMLKQRIQLAFEEGFDGVVITHGTDTLEETAYFLDLTINESIAVVLTGAMRSSNEIGSDGVYNFVQAVITAANEKTKEQGVVVVMNDEIHAARFVTKTHTTSVDTFRTPTFGPIGILSKHEVYYLKEVVDHQIKNIQTTNGRVILLKAYAGMDTYLFEKLADDDIDGLVIEALGAGNLPPTVVPSLKKVIDKGIPVALVSRCSNGIAQDIYDYPGGGVELKKMGVNFVKGLSGQKARLRLLVGLNAGLSGNSLKDFLVN
ncbi:L-asparaginase [Vagococcus penaei]|uniref:asparaginase n=1 Tax=Vagococcus penaei TaxID=633807 RepID=A0A1Q2D8G1_9ENTE|nr:asparaginase [Vagococcus penaei]AQP54708.1 L-asparaginase [Vagococcus penaei]RSU05362.1 L-asparaginase [Vagococcus penaei]